MPQMANIVVKAANGTTDFTFTQLSAASGDGGQAQWRGPGSAPILAGNLRCESNWNRARTVRQVSISGDIPAVAIVGGVEQVLGRVSIRLTAQVPMAVPAASAKDASAILTNAIASSLVKEVIETGFAPT
uniref:Uncharacterized protein n=1 Tax=Hubei levi-like virus 3 TaxID=1922915 RepID=A0A1L3KIQ9_9VIRU|nr:hypothetical protein [Hubei levi-like virus 3]